MTDVNNRNILIEIAAFQNLLLAWGIIDDIVIKGCIPGHIDVVLIVNLTPIKWIIVANYSFVG